MTLDLAPPPVPDTRTKAAIIVRLLRRIDADLSLSSLPARTQVTLARSMGEMGAVDRATVDATVDDFTQAVEAMALPSTGGYRGALSVLDGQLSPDVAAQVAEESTRNDPNHAWLSLAKLSDDDLNHVLTTESTEISSLLLSKLPSAQAARLLGTVPGPRARRIACLTPKLDRMSSDAVTQIAQALYADYCMPKPVNFDKDAVDRMGDILNSTSAARRDEVLTGLDEDDPDFALRVRRAIFTFENIPERIDPLDVPKLIRTLDSSQLTIALGGALNDGGALGESAEFVLNNMSKRMASQIRDEINGNPPPKPKDVETTQAFILDAIRNAVDSGEISLIEEDG